MTISLDFPFDTQTLGFIQQLVKMSAENKKHEPVPPEADPSDNQIDLQQVAVRFAELLDEAAAHESLGQRQAMIGWLRLGGKAALSDLVAATGVQDGTRYAAIGSALTRNMGRALGDLPNSRLKKTTRCIGVPSFPGSWYGSIKEKGKEFYILDSKLVPYLKQAFAVA